MSQPPESKEILKLITELKTLLRKSDIESKKIDWEISEFCRALGDLKNMIYLMKASGPYLNEFAPRKFNDENKNINSYWNSLRDGYGDI